MLFIPMLQMGQMRKPRPGISPPPHPTGGHAARDWSKGMQTQVHLLPSAFSVARRPSVPGKTRQGHGAHCRGGVGSSSRAVRFRGWGVAGGWLEESRSGAAPPWRPEDSEAAASVLQDLTVLHVFYKVV